jgi:hypothetical protein
MSNHLNLLLDDIKQGQLIQNLREIELRLILVTVKSLHDHFEKESCLALSLPEGLVPAKGRPKGKHEVFEVTHIYIASSFGVKLGPSLSVYFQLFII